MQFLYYEQIPELRFAYIRRQIAGRSETTLPILLKFKNLEHQVFARSARTTIFHIKNKTKQNNQKNRTLKSNIN